MHAWLGRVNGHGEISSLAAGRLCLRSARLWTVCEGFKGGFVLISMQTYARSSCSGQSQVGKKRGLQRRYACVDHNGGTRT